MAINNIGYTSSITVLYLSFAALLQLQVNQRVCDGKSSRSPFHSVRCVVHIITSQPGTSMMDYRFFPPLFRNRMVRCEMVLSTRALPSMMKIPRSSGVSLLADAWEFHLLF